MSRLVDLDKLLDDFQELEAETHKAEVEKAFADSGKKNAKENLSLLLGSSLTLPELFKDIDSSKLLKFNPVTKLYPVLSMDSSSVSEPRPKSANPSPQKPNEVFPESSTESKPPQDDDSEVAEPSTSVDIYHQTITFKEDLQPCSPPLKTVGTIPPNQDIPPNQNVHIPGSETEMVTRTVSETVCQLSPPAPEVIDVNEDFPDHLFPSSPPPLSPESGPVVVNEGLLTLSPVVDAHGVPVPLNADASLPPNVAMTTSPITTTTSTTTTTTITAADDLPNLSLRENGDESLAPPLSSATAVTPLPPPPPPPPVASSPPQALTPEEWASDDSSSVCVACGARFTVLRRRHHCRVCGRLLCGACTPHRVPLLAAAAAATSVPSSSSPPREAAMLFETEARPQRVCAECFTRMAYQQQQQQERGRRDLETSSSYASTESPQLQQTVPARPSQPPCVAPLSPPLVVAASAPEPTTIERSEPSPAVASRNPFSPAAVTASLRDECLIPTPHEPSWPPLVIATCPELVLEYHPSNNRVESLFSSTSESSPTATFAVTRNVHVCVSCHSTADYESVVWSFASRGLATVGQEEILLLVRRLDPQETHPPLDALWFFYVLYDIAFAGRRSPYVSGSGTQTRSSTAKCASPIEDGACLLPRNPAFQAENQPEDCLTWFGGTCCGFLFKHLTPDDLSSLPREVRLPRPPFLASIALRSLNEAAWANRHPFRLLLALKNSQANPLIFDRCRPPAFDCGASISVLSLCCGNGVSKGVSFVCASGMHVLLSGRNSRVPELRLQLQLKKSSQERVRRALQGVGRGESLIFGLAGDFCHLADAHLVVEASKEGLLTRITPQVTEQGRELILGASFILFEAVDGSESSLSVVEDGCIARLTTEQFRALLTHIRNASPLQLRVEDAHDLPECLGGLSTSAAASSSTSDPAAAAGGCGGALITLDWTEESVSLQPTALHYSCIDGRPVEPRSTFIIPREHQLRHWLRLQLPRQSATPLDVETEACARPRIAWSHLHLLAPHPVYAVDNRSGEVLDFFAVFNAVAGIFVSTLFPYSEQLRKANHRSISLRILLQPPNTFNFYIGSNCSLQGGQSFSSGLSPTGTGSDWWQKTEPSSPGPRQTIDFPPRPLISDPGYVNGIDSAFIPLLDGLVHNISCSWFLDASGGSNPEAREGLTAPGLLLEFDVDLLD